MLWVIPFLWEAVSCTSVQDPAYIHHCKWITMKQWKIYSWADQAWIFTVWLWREIDCFYVNWIIIFFICIGRYSLSAWVLFWIIYQNIFFCKNPFHLLTFKLWHHKDLILVEIQHGYHSACNQHNVETNDKQFLILWASI